MKQHWNKYTAEDHDVWRILFERQHAQLAQYASTEYNECLTELGGVFNQSKIPRITDLSQNLLDRTGWTIKIVPGLIPARDFLQLLDQKIFCSSTWLRTRAQLDYLEEPDMFHDLFGHVPLLIHPLYSDFMQLLGELSMEFNRDEHIELLERLYWYTIEFGLVENTEGRSIYGAGILSSYGETKSVMEDEVSVQKFDLDKVLHTGFTKSEMQTGYYSIGHVDDLIKIIPKMRKSLELSEQKCILPENR